MQFRRVVIFTVLVCVPFELTLFTGVLLNLVKAPLFYGWSWGWFSAPLWSLFAVWAYRRLAKVVEKEFGHYGDEDSFEDWN